MQIINFPPVHTSVGARGRCPHSGCGVESLFSPVGQPNLQLDPTNDNYMQICNAAQCQACKKFVLIVGRRQVRDGGVAFSLVSFYPTGTPDDSVNEAIPASIAADFAEAKRCRWIRAYKATVVMCRRAIQASCVDLGAKDGRLVAQIDEIAGKGIITDSLRLYAHEIRLEGNDGAHPDKDGLADIVDRDADDVLAFSEHFLDHVYVMPAKLRMRKAIP